MEQTKWLSPQEINNTIIYPNDISIYDPRWKLNWTKWQIIKEIIDVLTLWEYITGGYAHRIIFKGKIITILKSPEAEWTITFNDWNKYYSIDSQAINNKF